MTTTSTGPALEVHVDLPGRLVASIAAAPGEVVAVVGPNGAGKTTLVESVAGTLGGPTAEVRVDGASWTGLPPHRRSAGLVFQEHLLFPHLDALSNVAFGARSRGVARRRADGEARAWLERLGVARQAAQRPGTLSGGEGQRVALARALASAPRVLLLDEPFAALDVAVAAELREVLAVHLRAFTGVTLLVTHDALDVRALADRVVVLEGGAVAQDDTRAAVAEAPATSHAARLLGLNVLPGLADGTEVALDGGGTLVTSTPAHGRVLATFAPSAVTLTRDEPVGSARNRWRTTVRRTVERDGVVRVHARGEHELYADVTGGSAADLELGPDRIVWASVKATEVTVFAVTPIADDR